MKAVALAMKEATIAAMSPLAMYVIEIASERATHARTICPISPSSKAEFLASKVSVFIFLSTDRINVEVYLELVFFAT